MAIRILSVMNGSIADRIGIEAGETLLQINGEDIIDDIDYQALTSDEKLVLSVEGKDRVVRTLKIKKKSYTPLGIRLDERIILQPRRCRNKCLFCFVDQLPKGMRETLYVKDDDWRLSLMMGNFVTLTNVNDKEFDRIIRRKASPLYISVHATDPETRVRLLGNKTAGNILQRLKIMKENGLKFHCQVVLCPGINDGLILHKTMIDLAGLAPSALSLAIVPVGLTAHRNDLSDMRMFTRDEAAALIDEIKIMQNYFLHSIGTRFVYASDELFCIAGLPTPSEDDYEGFPQIENGVGMLSKMEAECESFFSDAIAGTDQISEHPRHVIIATGFSAYDFICKLAEKYSPRNVLTEVLPVKNRFFGETVTVAGLLVGRDLIAALKGKECDEVLLSSSMFRENTDCFLDNMTLTQVKDELGLNIKIVENTGEAFIRSLYGNGGIRK